ncbi:MAG: hypothetical protein ACR2O6_02980, partial [Ilumatobacteraceae bacterium]
MITNRSKKREIRDLQRLLVTLGYMAAPRGKDKGWWSNETQEAVITAHKMIGWPHPSDGKWVSAPALAMMAATAHSHGVDQDGKSTSFVRTFAGGPGTYAGGPGTYAGGPGTYAGGPGTYAGGPGSYAGGPGSYAGGPGSYAGGPGSYAGGPGSHAGGPGSHAGGPGSHAGGPGSHAGGPGSHAGGPGSH